ncbi:hypothetical protein H0H81_003239 [Sphagnurus paluster]|uniref:ABM domain-containing protein n=1 Tax=Sphagnurus paluster TaxID=117069 RepID=A0A9P7KMS3_9AGAR|nr:hypothetical protein H0H81_003239 [Sphagnurus paluster]
MLAPLTNLPSVWESYEHHMKLTQEPAYPEMIKSIAPAVSGPTDLQHVDFDEDATKALDAPATEVVVLTPKSGTAQEDFDAKIATLRESLNKEPACHVVAVGESREKKGTWFMLIGWDSIEAHMDVAAKDALKEIVKSFFAIADVDLVHTNLVKHTA